MSKDYKMLHKLRGRIILTAIRNNLSVYRQLDKVIDGSTPPSLLVGEYGYPKVRVMLNIPPKIYGWKARIYDSPMDWWGKFDLDDIIKFRCSLVASTLVTRVEDPWKLYEKEINLSSVSRKPVDSEVKLESRPKPRLDLNNITKPLALHANAIDIKITSNPVIGNLLEKRIYDDVKAEEVITELYTRGYDIYTLINALSGGLLGRLKNRRIVPTRWAITAVDSILGNYYRRRLIDKPVIDTVYAFKGEYLGNKFLVIYAPGPLELEWIEVWHPRILWSNNLNTPSAYMVYEDIYSRQTEIDGGYLAARLPALEYLYRIGRQASVLIYREILPEYYAPVGNWHIRETVKHLLKNKPTTYQTLHEALENELRYFKVKKETWINRSRLAKEKDKQQRLERWF